MKIRKPLGMFLIIRNPLLKTNQITYYDEKQINDLILKCQKNQTQLL
jgi:hypothetical protein